MELNEYQKQAKSTCTKSSFNVSYMAFNLVGEVGEVVSKLAKAIRKDNVVINENKLCFLMKDEERKLFVDELKKELGDVLWQLSELCDVLNLNLDDVALNNLSKLADRKKRNVIIGDGDNR